MTDTTAPFPERLTAAPTVEEASAPDPPLTDTPVVFDFECANGHRYPYYSGQPGSPYEKQVWYGDYAPDGYRQRNNWVKPGDVCGAPASDHPTLPQMMFPTQVNPDDELDGSTDVSTQFAVASHPYIGDGTQPCQHHVALPRLVGFLCVECGAQLKDMPTKDA